MSKRMLKPKYVGKSHNWCVTIFKETSQAKKNAKSELQTQSWFATEEEALAFVKAQEETE